MNIFLFWLVVVLLALAGYLAYLWWHPRRRSRFQVRLTAIFLLFALVPTVPLIFLASTLATDTADVLLVPEVETAMLKAVEALKAQCEDTGKRCAQAFLAAGPDTLALANWGIDYYLLWQRTLDQYQLAAAYSRKETARELGLHLDAARMRELWGQTGSELEAVPAQVEVGAGTELTGHCRMWLPHRENEMVVLGYEVAPEVMPAKAQLLQTLRIYNSLTLIKEKALQDQLLWGAASIVVLVLSLSAVFMAQRLSRRLSHPLEELIGVTAQVATGDLQVQARTLGQDEIGQLIAAFNKMIQDLRLNREKLLAAERLAAWREVARQVSHEIKNPLTPIQLALYRMRQRLGETVTTQPALQESLQSIEEELRSLGHLAEEFSAFARLPKAEPQPDNLNDLVLLTVRLYESSSDHVHFQLHLDPQLPMRPYDREQIKRLLNNLIKNAIEAAQRQPSEISITTRAEPERVYLEISDNGPGLTPEMQARLFQPNFTTKRGGSGLGLVMVKRIVEEHGGEITVTSEVGKGTCFHVSF